VLRIHFTARDLGSVRIAAAPDPLWELSLSMHVLRLRNSDPWLSHWKNSLLHRLAPQSALRAEVALPLALNPPLGYFPDFLTPAEGSQGFDAGLDAVLSTPRQRIQREMAAFGAAHSPRTRRAASLGSGAAAALHDLGRAMGRYHEVALVPIWDRVQRAFHADRALRARCLTDGGVAALLNSLHPSTTYGGGVLQISNYISDRVLHLDGRGLLLVPSYFKRDDKPLVLADPQLTPVLIYPVSRDLRSAADRRGNGITTLLGRTRAAVLEMTADGLTTSGMAAILGISAAAVSQHVAVLRGVGLIMSVRRGTSVHHGLTALGQALLAGGSGASVVHGDSDSL